MEGIFLGFKIGPGLVLALAVSWWIWRKVAAWRLTLLFMTKTACTFQQGNGATPTLSAFVASICGPLVGARQSGFEQ